MTAVAIHQPEYFPWLGFFDKVGRADVLVLLDHVQFDRSSLQHRTRIVGPNGPFWLTIPFVHKFPQRIDEVRIADGRFRRKHWTSIKTAYGRAPGFADAASMLEALFAKDSDRVVDLAKDSIELLLDAFDVRPPRIVSSAQMGITTEKGDLVLDVCKALGASTYIAGKTGASYLDHEVFRAAGIAIEIQSYVLPSYVDRPVVSADEMRGVSALDAWLHLGERGRDLVSHGGRH